MIIYRDNQPPLLADYGIEVPMLKGRAQKVHEELINDFGPDVFFKGNSPELTTKDFLRAHTSDFIKRCTETPEKVMEETFELVNKDGSYNRYNPSSAKKPLKELVGIYRESCSDTFQALLLAQKHTFAYYLGGGFHHSLSTQGRGFCLFNDIVISARKFQEEVRPGNFWIIDIDAHKGCGTAEMTLNDSSISTLSIHMQDGWPMDSGEFDTNGKQYPWFIPSTVDIGIKAGEEKDYLSKLEAGLKELEGKSQELPTMCIVVDGSDPYEGDALPSANLLQLSKEQCFERNMLVYKFLKKRNIPQAYVMSGGYGDKNWIIHHQFLNKVLSK